MIKKKKRAEDPQTPEGKLLGRYSGTLCSFVLVIEKEKEDKLK